MMPGIGIGIEAREQWGVLEPDAVSRALLFDRAEIIPLLEPAESRIRLHAA
jgi:hypothetical protein